jgi:cytochrome c
MALEQPFDTRVPRLSSDARSDESIRMRAQSFSRTALAMTVWLGGMSLASLASAAATSAGTPTAADFSRCSGCHSTQAGQNKIGPSLADVFGKRSGTVPGYNYSAALKNAHLTWDEQTLDKFLQNPAGLVHGTKMFAAVPDADARQRVIAYLKSLRQPQSGTSK